MSEEMKRRFADPRVWLHGLGSAFISGGASTLSAYLGMTLARDSGV